MVSFLRGRVTWHGDWWTIASGQISCQSDTRPNIGGGFETAPAKPSANPTMNPVMIGAMSNNRRYKSILLVVSLLLSIPYRFLGADANPEWERVVGMAKKEGKVAIGAPPGPDFRNEVQGTLKKRLNLDSEFVQARGPNLMSKIVAEKQAGAVSVDAFLIGPCTGNSLLKADLFEPLAPAMILP